MYFKKSLNIQLKIKFIPIGHKITHAEKERVYRNNPK